MVYLKALGWKIPRVSSCVRCCLWGLCGDGLEINIELALCLKYSKDWETTQRLSSPLDFRSIPEQSSPAYIVTGHPYPYGEMATPGFQQPRMCDARLLCAHVTQGVAQSKGFDAFTQLWPHGLVLGPTACEAHSLKHHVISLTLYLTLYLLCFLWESSAWGKHAFLLKLALRNKPDLSYLFTPPQT